MRDTARRLGVHENTVRNWVRSGLLSDARVPGSRFHRFRADEVDRLLAQRGATVKSLQSERRTVNPELVDASQLAQWPVTRARDAQERFPELVRRLLVETPGISSISVRSGDGVALPGYDGLAEAEKTAFLAEGHLSFEFGVDKSPTQKATADYNTRAAQGPSDRTFVFVTPRRWAGKQAWAQERRKQGIFADVCVLDADDLEGWLNASPAAHYWISEHLGLRPRDAQTIENWWERFSESTSPALPSALFTAGRGAQSGQLLTRLAGPPTLTLIESEWRQDCLAFVYASTRDEEGEPSAGGRSIIIVSAGEVWDRILDQPGQAVLVPLFDGANVSRALDRGHQVISVVDHAVASRRGVDIRLPRADRSSAAEAIGSVGVEFRRAQRLAVLARRSLPALARQLSRNPGFQRPDWATGPDATVLAPLVLVGSWTTGDRDVAAVQRLTGHPWEVIEETAIRLGRTVDPVLRRVGATWMFASPEEAFLLLRDSISQRALERWSSEAKKVLMEPSPLLGLTPEERFPAQLRTPEERCSAIMRRGLAQGLALMGAMGTQTRLDDGSSLADVAALVVRELLRSANDDPTGRGWELLGPELPLLAEAAPDEFLTAADEGLIGRDPVLLRLFQEDRQSSLPLGPSSPHPSLLWAIETVTWSEQHLLEGVRILARLAELDPGGKSGNRPSSSLATLLCGWVRNTSAPLDVRLEALDATFSVSDRVGWRLILDLWPRTHGWIMPPASPRIRDDWQPATSSLPMSEWAAFAQGLVSRAIQRAATDAGRLGDLVRGLDSIAPSDRERVLAHIERLTSEGALDHQARLELWDKVQGVAARHERFSAAEWAMPLEVLDRLRTLAVALEPASDPLRFAYLFDWHPDLPGHEQTDFEVYSARLAELRADALRDVLLMPDWDVQLADLARRAKVPGQLGWALADEGDIHPSVIISWLEGEGSELREAALNYMRNRMYLGGPEWLLSFLRLPQLAAEAREAVLRQVPPRASYWQALKNSPDPTDAETYWTTAPMEVVELPDVRDAVNALVRHERAWSAIAVASHALRRAEGESETHADALTATELIALLAAALNQAPREGEIGQMTGYYLGEILDHLASTDAPRDAIAGFEFAFYRLLEHHREPVVLNHALASEPDLFVELVKRVYRGKNEPARKRSQSNEDYARQAWWVLREWVGFPGRRDDGTLDPEAMRNWVVAARLQLSDSDRADIGDEVIGQTFAHAPSGDDGIWPSEPVRDMLEAIGSRDMENGLVIGRINSRGVTVRGAFDGGDQERVLASMYRRGSRSTRAAWPRTSRILRELAESYERDAKREDLRAELDADQV